MLAELRHTRLRLQLDRTEVDGRFNVLMVSLYRRKRALPLVWQVLPHHKGNSDYDDWRPLFEYLVELIPDGARVLLLGDREFGNGDVMQVAVGYGWDYCLRVKGDQLVRVAGGDWQPLATLPLQPGERRYLTDVTFTKRHCYHTHFALAWAVGSQDVWYIATNLPPSQRTLTDYHRRFGCEELFSDLKARGFDLERSQLVHQARFERLLLAVALLTVWLLTVGRRVLVSGQGRTLRSVAHHDELSLFQIGYRWLLHQLALGRSLHPDLGYTFWQLAPK
jgi:hypothetical protein